MKLYYSPGACSMAAHILLHETGVKHTTEKVDLKGHTYSKGDYYKVNPKGYVPALELDNGERLTENVAVLQYIADQKPEANLLPKAGTFERYRAIEWLAFVSTEIHKAFSPLWNPQTPEATKTSAKESLAKRFDYLSERIKQGQFLMGSNFSAPDAYLFTVLGWAQHLGIDMSKWPALMGYMERITSRPGVQAAMRTEGLIK